MPQEQPRPAPSQEIATLINSVFAQLHAGHVPAKPELERFEHLIRQAARVPAPEEHEEHYVARSLTGRLLGVGASLLEKLHHHGPDHPDAPAEEQGQAPATPDVAAAAPARAAKAPPAAASMAPAGAPQSRERQAKDPNTPAEVLSKLATDEDSGVRLAVAHNANTSPVLLMHMAEDADLMVRAAVAANPRTPLRALTKLTESEAMLVRLRAAQNPQATEELLTTLGNDMDPKVRMAVVRNNATSDYTLSMLETDSDDDVKHAAMEVRSIRAENVEIHLQ